MDAELCRHNTHRSSAEGVPPQSALIETSVTLRFDRSWYTAPDGMLKNYEAQVTTSLASLR
jgi:hypothetical protein